MRAARTVDPQLAAALARIDELQAENLSLRMQVQDLAPLARPGTMALLLNAVVREFDIAREAITSVSRDAEAALARQVAMLVATRCLHRGAAHVGRCLNRDHSTVLHGARVIAARLQNDPVLAARVARVVAAVTTPANPEVQ